MKLVRSTATPAASARAATRLDVVLEVLHVLVPQAADQQAELLWSHLREDVLDARTTLRLRQNGLRVGVGHAQWWEAVHATLAAIDGVRSLAVNPVRVPPNYPLALELDTGPREQTLFCIGDDGILTGETWPHSRNVLRLSYTINLESPDAVRLTMIPEVRQWLEGWEWVRNEAGLTKRPNYTGRAYPAAGFILDLQPGEFLLVAPGVKADVYGLIGSAFLSRDDDGERFDSYVFLRADVNHVAQRD
jgi:hypothetical protein